jgi:hypothetical protein
MVIKIVAPYKFVQCFVEPKLINRRKSFMNQLFSFLHPRITHINEIVIPRTAKIISET